MTRYDCGTQYSTEDSLLPSYTQTIIIARIVYWKGVEVTADTNRSRMGCIEVP